MINFGNPKDLSTSVFRVVRLRYYRDVLSDKTKEQIQTAREEPSSAYLCTSVNKKLKTRNYDWMTLAEVNVYKDWKIYETSSIQKAQDLVCDNKIYFLNLESTSCASKLYTYGPAYVLPTHGNFLLMRVVSQGFSDYLEYFQVQPDETTVVTTNVPFLPKGRNFYWTRTLLRASMIDPMEYPFMTFIANFCKGFNQALGACPEEYKFRYIHDFHTLPYSPSVCCVTLLAAKEASPPESHPSELDINESWKTRSMLIEETASCPEPPPQKKPHHQASTVIEQMHASCYLSLEQTYYQEAEKVIDLICREEMPPEEEDLENWMEENKENLDPTLQTQYAQYLDWASSLEQPSLEQLPHGWCSSSPSWSEQMHSEGLLVASGTL
jgi:hypothetical protein